MTNEDIVKIGEEMVKVLEPVYEQLDRIEKTQNEHTDKIDALTVDMIQVQDELGAIKDDLGEFKRHNQKEHTEIKKHIEIPIVA